MNAITSFSNKPTLSPQIEGPLVPVSVEDLGIPVPVLENLLIKHLSHECKADYLTLSRVMGVSSHIVEELMQPLRKRSLIEVFQNHSSAISTNKNRVLFGLSSMGLQEADIAFLKDAYIGPVPVTIDEYNYVVNLQDIRRNNIGRDQIESALSGVFGAEYMVPVLGPALNSGRALLLYGHAGTGKSYVAAQLINSFDTSVYIPFSVYCAGNIVKVFSEQHHTKVDNNSTADTLRFEEQYDRRWTLCERPNIQVGGELTLEMLEVNHSEHNRVWLAPLQMLANNGLLVIDDLGRQSVSVSNLLNRWIVPMEYAVDHLVLPNGQQTTIPFVLTLAFSTNLNPLDIGDPAFLRRLGYKIEFHALNEANYISLVKSVCVNKEVTISTSATDYLLSMHKMYGVPYYPCIPKDIVGVCGDIIRFEGESEEITANILDAAWRLYFTSDGMGGVNHD
ncbi:AAA family ATPase [Vibrio sp. SCSIO 43140]|uniref:ATP-binding protein n=1 Tax=Vibrio sp. SCSIO 43140 TaxID=2819100 RepID=UPI00207562C7|nr:AAA family ATPase [Vibrio sp. SCSIO 43140]USD61771.1 AAA family ATPase [Vibrio sp. SCSIO 43140]